jgi:hypothetical protein
MPLWEEELKVSPSGALGNNSLLQAQKGSRTSRVRGSFTFPYLYPMRVLSYIFCLYILALFAVPCQDKDCCMDELNQTPSSHNKSEAPCSPFVTCGTCDGFIIPATTPELPKPTSLEKRQMPPFIAHYLGDFSPSTWQPPKQA